MIGTLEKRVATGCSATGLPTLRSNGLARPSFLRTPTVRTPQCTNTAVPGAEAASSKICCAGASPIAYPCIDGNRHIVRSAPVARAAEGCGGRRHGIGPRRIDHEEPDEARWMPRDRGRHRRSVAGHARNQRGAADVVAIELGDPAIGERLGRAGWRPPEPGDRRIAAER